MTEMNIKMPMLSDAIDQFPMDLHRLLLQVKKLYGVGPFLPSDTPDDVDYLIDEVYTQLLILCERFTTYCGVFEAEHFELCRFRRAGESAVQVFNLSTGEKGQEELSKRLDFPTGTLADIWPEDGEDSGVA